ncbi:endo alpha-1,4 polygalactosaminidase [Streptomyces longispororuber]|uniref:endo alpha-1,4 polygalactosaminidase n=1 Tax=Streptomyces longispororuber TaxID=68230 RepID=UPI0033C124B7
MPLSQPPGTPADTRPAAPATPAAAPAHTPATPRNRTLRTATTAITTAPAVALALATALTAALLTGCSGNGDGPSSGDRSHKEKAMEKAKERAAGTGEQDRPAPRLPRPRAPFDYQLGGAYDPPAGVRAVSRDRAAKPVPGRYNICYVNAFQAQPGRAATKWWQEKHPELLLRDPDGDLVIDQDWNEPLFDISTAAKRKALLKVVGPWIDGCARSGFDAVEPDNLDSYTRSDGELDAADGQAFARLLARRAHDRGLAIGQKNTTEFLDKDLGFDFAVVEECGQYDECGPYVKAYDGRVFDIEYENEGYEAACRRWHGKLSVILRDRDVRPAGEDGYVYRRC